MEKIQVIQQLNACAVVCNTCYDACLEDKEISVLSRCIELTRECADICQVTASAYVRDSENIDKYLRLCAELSEICAEECERHDNEQCTKCAKVCRRCAEMCFALQPVY